MRQGNKDSHDDHRLTTDSQFARLSISEDENDEDPAEFQQFELKSTNLAHRKYNYRQKYHTKSIRCNTPLGTVLNTNTSVASFDWREQQQQLLFLADQKQGKANQSINSDLHFSLKKDKRAHSVLGNQPLPQSPTKLAALQSTKSNSYYLKLQKTISIKGKNKLLIVPKETNGDINSQIPKTITGIHSSSASKGSSNNYNSNSINYDDHISFSSKKTLELYNLIQTVKGAIHSQIPSKLIKSPIKLEQRQSAGKNQSFDQQQLPNSVKNKKKRNYSNCKTENTQKNEIAPWEIYNSSVDNLFSKRSSISQVLGQSPFQSFSPPTSRKNVSDAKMKKTIDPATPRFERNIESVKKDSSEISFYVKTPYKNETKGENSQNKSSIKANTPKGNESVTKNGLKHSQNKIENNPDSDINQIKQYNSRPCQFDHTMNNNLGQNQLQSIPTPQSSISTPISTNAQTNLLINNKRSARLFQRSQTPSDLKRFSSNQRCRSRLIISEQDNNSIHNSINDIKQRNFLPLNSRMNSQSFHRTFLAGNDNQFSSQASQFLRSRTPISRVQTLQADTSHSNSTFQRTKSQILNEQRSQKTSYGWEKAAIREWQLKQIQKSKDFLNQTKPNQVLKSNKYPVPDKGLPKNTALPFFNAIIQALRNLAPLRQYLKSPNRTVNNLLIESLALLFEALDSNETIPVNNPLSMYSQDLLSAPSVTKQSFLTYL